MSMDELSSTFETCPRDVDATELLDQCETSPANNYLIAYLIDEQRPMEIIPASSGRKWMDQTPNRFANRCLPLLIANQAGWVVLSPITVRALWHGGDSPSSIEIECLDGTAPWPVCSHFGCGIITWNLPYVFRTPPGVNLLVRGPANSPKDAIWPLEGIIETDWSVATFTMNWKFTRTHVPVTFEQGEPICMILPQVRGELEAVRTQVRLLSTEPEIESGYRCWSQSRDAFNRDLKQTGSEAVRRGWQKDYFRGASPSGLRSEDHQSKLFLKPFELTQLPSNKLEEVVK